MIYIFSSFLYIITERIASGAGGGRMDNGGCKMKVWMYGMEWNWKGNTSQTQDKRNVSEMNSSPRCNEGIGTIRQRDKGNTGYRIYFKFCREDKKAKAKRK